MDQPPAIDQPSAWRPGAAGKRLRSMLILALALHAAAVLVPFSKPAPTNTPATFDVTLEPSALPEQPAIPAPTPSAAERNAAAVRPIPSLAQATAPGPVPPDPAVADVHAAPPPALSAAVLFQLAHELRWTEPDGPPRVPGEPRLPGLPAKLARPLLPFEPTRFAAHMLPLKAEILDHWQEAGGVQRVVIRSTDGENYCGRREAWDPLNPLFEPVMLFHRCAGGGRRKPPAAPPLRREG